MNSSLIISILIIIMLLINRDKYINENEASLTKSLMLPIVFLIVFISILLKYSINHIILALSVFTISVLILTLLFLKINSNLYYKKNDIVYRKKSYTLVVILITSLVIKIVTPYLFNNGNIVLVIQSLSIGLSFSRLFSNAILIALKSKK